MATALLAGCGARTGLIDKDAGGYCASDRECDDGRFCNGAEQCLEGRCRRGPPPSCDDADACTDDTCDEAARRCAHATRRVDRDRDGFFAIERVASCGDDCDDTNAAVFPGAREVCNGIDDDCDAQIDEGASYTPSGAETQLTMDRVPSGGGGVAFSPVSGTWGAVYATDDDVFFRELSEDGAPRGAPKLLTPNPGDAFAPSVVWNGDAYAIAWEDRRSGDFEIYFNRLSPDGEKLAVDLRVTDARGFSIYPRIAWTGSEHVVAFQDARNEVIDTGNMEIYLAFLDADGFEIADELRLTTNSAPSEAPVIAVSDAQGPRELGVAYVDAESGTQQVWLIVTDLEGRIVQRATRLSTGARRAVNPSIAWADDAFLVAWQETSPAGDLDLVGVRVQRSPARPPDMPVRIAAGPSFARGATLLSNGDRVVVAYADDVDGASFDLYSRLYDTRFVALADAERVTRAAGDSVGPALGRGPTSLGVLFDDQRDGDWEVFFTRLLCAR